MEMDAILIAFSLTLFAGLATSIGSAIAFFSRTTNTLFLSLAMAFSAGVMIYVSFIEIFPKSHEALLAAGGGETISYIVTTAAFFWGILFTAALDKAVPTFENPHEPHKIEEMDDPARQAEFQKLYHIGLFAALAIALHNFPEGIATFIVALEDPALGFSVALAIAAHNIPEGIAVSIPIYFATNSRKRAFFFSSLSGLAEPLGALLAMLILMPFLNDFLFGVLFAFVGGIMVFVSFDQILPTAHKYGRPHLVNYTMCSGMAFMALSLILFNL